MASESAKLVMIVEDNDLNLKLFRDLLHAHGYRTTATQDGKQALSLARQCMPALILMDIQLPEISGLDVIQELKKDATLKTIPIVAVTAFAMKSDEEKIHASGCDSYLSKPISVGSFIATIQRFLEPAG